MNTKLKYLLPIRSIMFILIFIISSYITKKELNDISNWWSIVATVVNIITIILLILAIINFILLPLTIVFCYYYKKKKNSVPIMIGHAIVEIASVILVLITSISPEIYQTWLNM